MSRRIREVYPTREIPHLFAVSQVDASRAPSVARNPQGNMSYDGNLFRSYATVVASVVTIPARPHPRRVLLYSADKYSVTTAKQLSDVVSAWGMRGPRFEVPEVQPSGTAGRHSWTNHARNLVYFRAEIDRLVAEAKRSRTRRDRVYAEAICQWRAAREYCGLFRLSLRPFPPRELAAMETAAVNCTVEMLDRRAAASARSDARYAAQAERWRAAEELRHADDATRRAAWLAGSADYLGNMAGPTVLRLSPTRAGHVETSRGAFVPVHAARGMYVLLKSPARESVVGQTVGHYRVEQVEADALVIGCHTLTFGEIERFAASQGWGTSPLLAPIAEYPVVGMAKEVLP